MNSQKLWTWWYEAECGEGGTKSRKIQGKSVLLAPFLHLVAEGQQPGRRYGHESPEKVKAPEERSQQTERCGPPTITSSMPKHHKPLKMNCQSVFKASLLNMNSKASVISNLITVFMMKDNDQHNKQKKTLKEADNSKNRKTVDRW
jgi:hypothetical protein